MALPRVQLFEFNDLAHAPPAVRDTVVESLSRTLAWGRILRGVVPAFERFVQDTGADEILDLGSGGGGPAAILADELARTGSIARPRFVLTDLHPRVEVWERLRAARPGVLDYVADPVDATAIPDALADRPRMIVNVLHHLPPELAAALLRDAVRGGRGILVVEGFERNPLQFANFAVAGLPALLANPLLSPRDRLQKAVLTWLTPAALGLAVWDGLVSTLRVYTEAELRAMVAPFGAGWRWDYGRYRYPPLGTGYWFRGVPA